MADILKDPPVATGDSAELVEDPGLPEPTAPAGTAGPAPARWVWQGKMPDAFWKAATIFSLVMNLGLVIVLISLALLLFQIKSAMVQPLVTGLHTNFVAMDGAHIVSTIAVNDTIRVVDT